MNKKTILFLHLAFCLLPSAFSQFGPSATNYFPVATNTPATGMFLFNRPGLTNYNLAASNVLAYLNAVATTPLAPAANPTFSGTVTGVHLTLSGTLTADQMIVQTLTTTNFMIASNSLASWPTAPSSRGDACFVNSNGVVFLLTSGLGLTWTATNKLAP